jgi:hypothetical protein
MSQDREYHSRMQRLNRATRASFRLKLFALVLLGLMLTSVSVAQINGIPVSVTSPGFGGRQVNGIAPSVTSLGPRGYTPRVPTCCFVGGFPRNPNSMTNVRHHHHNGFIGGGYAAPFYGYYDSGSYADDNQPDDQNNDQYNGGPTVFDRRGPGTAPPSRAPTAATENPQSEPTSETAATQPEAAPAPEPPPTVLVFKDGHQVEVANYAIVGDTLFDLTGGRRRKIALADLDLTATAKQNDDRGIDFQLPAVPEAN